MTAESQPTYGFRRYVVEHQEGGKFLGEEVAEVAVGLGDRPILASLAMVLNEPLLLDPLAEMPEGEDDVGDQIAEVEGNILADESRKSLVFRRLVARLASPQRLQELGELIANGEGTVDQIAELRAGVKVLIEKVGAPEAGNIREFVEKIEKLEQAITALSSRDPGQPTNEVSGDVVAKLDEVVAAIKAGEGDRAEEMMSAISLSSGGSGGAAGLMYGHPAYERYMQTRAALAIYREIAGIRPDMNQAERKEIVNEMVLIFSTGQATGRYVSTLVLEALNTFDVATSTLEMAAGLQKVKEVLPKLWATVSGAKDELGGLGAQMPNGPEAMALFLNAKFDGRVITRRGAEKLIKYSFARAWDFYHGDGRKPMELSKFSVEELRDLFRQYDEIFKARYGEDFNAMRVYGKFVRIKDYRRDLLGPRTDIPADVGMEKEFEGYKSEILMDFIELRQRARDAELQEGDFESLKIFLSELRVYLMKGVEDPDEMSDIAIMLDQYNEVIERLAAGEELNEEQSNTLRVYFEGVGGYLQQRDDLNMQTRIARGEELTGVERQFVEEILMLPVFVSESEEYSFAYGQDGQMTMTVGEKIIPALLSADQGRRLNLDVTAWPVFAKHNDPRWGASKPVQEWATRDLRDFTDNGFKEYILWEIAEAGIDLDEVVAVELTRDEMGLARRMMVSMGKSRGRGDVEELGLLPDSSLARIGKDGYSFLAVPMRSKNGGLVVDSVNALVPQARRNADGNPMYEPLWRRNKNNEFVTDAAGNRIPERDRRGDVIYQEYRDEAGNVVVVDGRPVFMPKLNDAGEMMLEMMKDDEGRLVPATPGNLLVKVIFAVRFAPFSDAFKALWFVGGMNDADFPNAGEAVPKGILKNHWEAYIRYYDIVSPYMHRFFRRNLDSLFVRKIGNSVMMRSLGSEVEAHRTILHYKDPLKNGDPELNRLEPITAITINDAERRRLVDINERLTGGVSLGDLRRADPAVAAEIDEMVRQKRWVVPPGGKAVVFVTDYARQTAEDLARINFILSEGLMDLEDLKIKEPTIFQRVSDMVSAGVWVAPDEWTARLFTPEEYVRFVMKDMLVTQDLLPHLVDRDDKRLNHMVGKSRFEWEQAWRDVFGNRSADEVRLEVAQNLGIADELNALKRLKFGQITPDQFLRKKQLLQMIEDGYGDHPQVREVGKRALNGVLSLGRKYAIQRKTSVENLAPVDYLVSQADAFKTVALMSPEDALIFANHLDVTDNLRSMGLPVDVWPLHMRQGRLGLLGWVGQIGSDKYDITAKDSFSGYTPYVGAEGSIQQEVAQKLDVELVRSDEGELIAAQVGVQPKEVRDLQDLIHQTMHMARGGLDAEKVAKQVEALTEGLVQMWASMSYRSAGGKRKERERLTASRVVFMLNTLFPTLQDARPMIMHGDVPLQEFFHDEHGHVLRVGDYPVVDPGQPGDKLVSLDLAGVSRDGGIKSSDDVAKFVIEGLRLGTVFMPEKDSKTPILVANPANATANKLHMHLNERGGWSTRPAWVDVNAAYGHESPRMTGDKHGDDVNTTKLKVARWILKRLSDSKAMNVFRDRDDTMREIERLTVQFLN
jgi:hypothetical protein